MHPTKVLGRPCFLPPWPRSLALQSHFSQERTDQIRSLLSRRVFGTRPTMPRPYGPTRPAEPSSTAQLQATLKDKCTAEWVLILKSCVASSKLAQALEASQHPQILVEASLRKFSGGTLSQYLCAIRLFLAFVHQCVGDLLSLTLAHLSDFIAGCHVSQAEDRTALKCSAVMMSKALSWFARIAQISSLLDLMSSPLIKSFAYSPKPHDRREALPLPLAILAAWEEHIVSPTCTPAVGLLLGALLLCAHCSLRFGDIQRIKPSALSLSAQALRGLCWATKTTCQGQPFACLPFGFRGEDISTSWLVKWLALLSQALDATQGRLICARFHFALRSKPGISHMPQPFTPDVLFAGTGLPSLGHTVAVEIGRRSAGYPA